MARFRKVWPKCDGLTLRNRRFTQADLVLIRKLIRIHPSWGRTKLSQEFCQTVDWRQPNGRLKERACRVALLKLESLGFLDLPKKKVDNGGRPPTAKSITEFDFDVSSQIKQMPEHLLVRLVNTKADADKWNSLIANYHYLGLATPVGRLIRYVVEGDGTILGAISFSEATWNNAPRNIAIANAGYCANRIHDLVVNNNRFLILPMVKVKNLASRILSRSLSQVFTDWKIAYNSHPLFVETFVDPSRFLGTCYKASNWLSVGRTKGYSKKGASHRLTGRQKSVWLKGLTKSAHARLLRNLEGQKGHEGPSSTRAA